MTEITCLTMGTILGGSDRDSEEWARAVAALYLDSRHLCSGVTSPLRVNILFLVDGRLSPNEFAGVRTGRYNRAQSMLIIQVAVAKAPVDDRRVVLVAMLEAAVAEAERYAIRKGIAEGLPEILRIIDVLGETDS